MQITPLFFFFDLEETELDLGRQIYSFLCINSLSLVMSARHVQEGGFVLGRKERVDQSAMSEWASRSGRDVYWVDDCHLSFELKHLV